MGELVSIAICPLNTPSKPTVQYGITRVLGMADLVLVEDLEAFGAEL